MQRSSLRKLDEIAQKLLRREKNAENRIARLDLERIKDKEDHKMSDAVREVRELKRARSQKMARVAIERATLRLRRLRKRQSSLI